MAAHPIIPVAHPITITRTLFFPQKLDMFMCVEKHGTNLDSKQEGGFLIHFVSSLVVDRERPVI